MASEKNRGFKGRRGAPRMNLLNVFRNDLKRRKIVNTLSNLDDLEVLRATAINKVFWKSLSNIKYDIKYKLYVYSIFSF